MSEKLGIQETKDLIDLGLKVVEVVKAVQADGKIDLLDLGQVMALLPAVGPALQGADKAPAELKDLDASEAAELVAHVMGKLAIENEKAVKIVEASLKAAVANYALFKAIQG